MNRTKIDWCDHTWNPVWGCLNNCPYCYARKLAKRFGDAEFKPAWKQKNFDKPFPKKPSRIFVNSMSDIRWWAMRWTNDVLNKIADHPWYTFLFLTKYPYIYSEYLFPSNCWLGVSVAKTDDFHGILMPTRNPFVSLEPLHGRIIPGFLAGYDWVIIGAESGNRKGKVIPRREWIAEIVDYCKENQIPVFLKDSLREIWGEPLIQEYPAQGRVIGGIE